MLKYILKRFAMMLVTLFIIITATFFLMRAIPGGPFSFDRVLPPSVEEALEAKYNLDKQACDEIGRDDKIPHMGLWLSGLERLPDK